MCSAGGLVRGPDVCMESSDGEASPSGEESGVGFKVDPVEELERCVQELLVSLDRGVGSDVITVSLNRGVDILKEHFGLAEVHVAEFVARLPPIDGMLFRHVIWERRTAELRLRPMPKLSKKRRLRVSGTGT